MKHFKLSYILFSICFLFSLVACLETQPAHMEYKASYQYTVTAVIDGDTITVTDGNASFRIRIAAMDAPEHQQKQGKAATQRLKSLVLNKKVTYHSVGTGLDRYGRSLGQIKVKDQDVSMILISEGLATYYRPFCKDYPDHKEIYNYEPVAYIQAEKNAQEKKLGVWFDADFIMPCQFRRLNKNK